MREPEPDVLPAFRFYVTLDGGDAYLPAEQAKEVPRWADAGFQEVSGLGAELEVFAYHEGGRNDFVHQLPVKHSWGRITLKRGLVRGDGLWRWYRAGLTYSLGARQNGSILLRDSADTLVWTWAFRGALAVKWSGPTFNAGQGAVAVESLELVHQGLDQVLVKGVP